MLTKEKLLKKLDRFLPDTVLELVNSGGHLCLIILESGKVLYNTKTEILGYKCPNNSMICNQQYACDACPYNEDLKKEK